MEHLNIWRMIQLENDIVLVSLWKDSKLHIVDLGGDNPPEYGPATKTIQLTDVDRDNINCTDLVHVPGFNYRSFPFIIKRGKVSLTLFDLKLRKAHIMYADDNGPWGYAKSAIFMTP